MHQYPTYALENGQRVSTGTGMRIEWQQGAFQSNPAGPNGSMLEQPVRAMLHHLDYLQAERPCRQNPEIMLHLNAILGLLDERTRERNARGVLGTEKV